MRTYNRIFLIGNCAATPICTTTKNGKPYLYFPVAINKFNHSENTEVDYHRIVIWGEIATKLEPLIQKGSRVFITGKLTNHKYESNETVKYITEIHASQIEVLSFKQNEENSNINKEELTKKLTKELASTK